MSQQSRQIKQFARVSVISSFTHVLKMCEIFLLHGLNKSIAYARCILPVHKSDSEKCV